MPMLLPQGVHVAHPEHLYHRRPMVPAHSGRLIAVISPDTEQVVAQVAEADATDMDAAVAAARRRVRPWPLAHHAPGQRIAAFRAMIAHLRPRADELARAWTAQIGGLASFAGPMHQGALMALDGIAGFAEGFRFIEQRPSHAAAAALIVQEPVGVVAAIAPWNGPFGSWPTRWPMPC
jgi:acyl-CoA reductase-like NAD-dependent aldehyde dehydrogenase